jgi:hypothetical protein
MLQMNFGEGKAMVHQKSENKQIIGSNEELSLLLVGGGSTDLIIRCEPTTKLEECSAVVLDENSVLKLLVRLIVQYSRKSHLPVEKGCAKICKTIVDLTKAHEEEMKVEDKKVFSKKVPCLLKKSVNNLGNSASCIYTKAEVRKFKLLESLACSLFGISLDQIRNSRTGCRQARAAHTVYLYAAQMLTALRGVQIATLIGKTDASITYAVSRYHAVRSTESIRCNEEEVLLDIGYKMLKAEFVHRSNV